MDEIDLRLSVLLMRNSRTPYRKLADEVDLSVNAVHSRVQKMVDMDIIQEFYTKISMKAFKGILIVSVEGKSELDDIENLIDVLGENKNTFKVAAASGNYLYVQGLLRDATEMSGYIESVKENGEIKDPELFMVDMSDFQPLEDFEYSKMDYEIIYSMHKDSRKSLSDVAEEVGVSSKTVRRRIDRMEEAQAIDFGIKIRPTQSSDFITFFEMDVKSDVERKIVASKIRKKHFPNINSTFLASNSPNKIVANVWTKTLDEIHQLKKDLREEGYLDSIKSRMYYNGKEFDTWRDDYLIEKVTG